MAKTLTTTKVRASKKQLATFPKPIAEVIREELHGAAKTITVHTVTTEFEFFPGEDMTFYLLKPGADTVSRLEFPNQESLHAGNMRTMSMINQSSTAPALSWVVISHRFLGGLYIDVYEVIEAPKREEPPAALPAPKNNAAWYGKAIERNKQAGVYETRSVIEAKLDAMSESLASPTTYQGDKIDWKGITLYWVPAMKRYVSIPEDK